jgi:hypothetical protein
MEPEEFDTEPVIVADCSLSRDIEIQQSKGLSQVFLSCSLAVLNPYAPQLSQTWNGPLNQQSGIRYVDLQIFSWMASHGFIDVRSLWGRRSAIVLHHT